MSLALVIAATAGVAHGDPATDQLVADGKALAAKGDYLGAAAKFRAAYAATQDVKYLCNQGIAYQRAKELPRAQYYFNLCVLRGSSLKEVDATRANLVQIESSLKAGNFTPVLVLTDPPNATYTPDGWDKDDPIPAGTQIWLPYGTHKVVITPPPRGSYVAQERTVEATGHDVVTLKVALAVGEQAPPPHVEQPPPPHVDKPPPDKHVDVVKPLPKPASGRPSSVPMVVAGSVGAAGLVTALVGLHFASRDADRAKFALTESVFIADRDSVSKWNDVFAAGAIAGAVGLAAGAYFGVRYFSYSPERGGGTASVAIRW